MGVYEFLTSLILCNIYFCKCLCFLDFFLWDAGIHSAKYILMCELCFLLNG